MVRDKTWTLIIIIIMTTTGSAFPLVLPSRSMTSSPIAAARASFEAEPLDGDDTPMDESEASSLMDYSQNSLRHRLQVDAHHRHSSRTYPPPAIVGHRGALYDFLENTRESFLRCAQLGCEAVELDVFLLTDGNIVVFHGGGSDEHPGELHDYCIGTHSKDVTILQLDYQQCQQLVFNTNNPEFPCPKHHIQRGKIPTLEQILKDLQPFPIEIKIELKGPNTADAVIQLVELLQMQDRCSYSSFDHAHIRRVRELRPNYRTGALFNDVPDHFIELAQQVGATEVHLRYDTCTIERIRAIHDAGMGSMAWFRGPVGMRHDCADKYWDIGNENEECYQVIFDTGVQQVCCNRPDVAKAMIGRQGRSSKTIAATQ